MHDRTFSDGAVGRMRHLQTRPAPRGQEDPQPPARCEDRHPPEKAAAAQKKTGSGGENDADAKTIVSHHVVKKVDWEIPMVLELAVKL